MRNTVDTRALVRFGGSDALYLVNQEPCWQHTHTGWWSSAELILNVLPTKTVTSFSILQHDYTLSDSIGYAYVAACARVELRKCSWLVNSGEHTGVITSSVERIENQTCGDWMGATRLGTSNGHRYP
eukprot:6182051-Pleurochrysis_carterae.AAC.9